MNPDVVVAAIVAVSGGGGLVALFRAWQDHKKGARDATMTGFEKVITTLREEVDRLKEDRTADRARIERIEAQITVERDLRWSAIQYVRVLLAWVSQHLPGVTPPSVPVDLAEHVIYTPSAVSAPSPEEPTP